jgi:hypothetical protein
MTDAAAGARSATRDPTAGRGAPAATSAGSPRAPGLPGDAPTDRAA